MYEPSFCDDHDYEEKPIIECCPACAHDYIRELTQRVAALEALLKPTTITTGN